VPEPLQLVPDPLQRLPGWLREERERNSERKPLRLQTRK